MQKNISIQGYQISRGNQNKLRKKSVVVFLIKFVNTLLTSNPKIESDQSFPKRYLRVLNTVSE